MNRRVKNAGLHLLGWMLFFSLIAVFTNRMAGVATLPQFLSTGLFVFLFVYVALFYVNAYVLVPKLYLRRKLVLYFLLSLLLFAGIGFLKPYERFVLHGARPEREGEPPRRFHPMRPPHFSDEPPQFAPRPQRRDEGLDIVSIVLFLGIWSFSGALPIIDRWRQTEQRALQAERDKVAAELSFLKAQINPHFLFNTLNNIYSLAIVKSEQTPAAILKLSEILHYITDDVQSDFVPLQSEVECVRNYIELQKLRLTEKVDVQYNIRGDLSGKQVAPLLFMTFVENAFKYGISSHEPCTITIAFATEEKKIRFYCRNQVMVKNSTEERTGVGVENAKKRLDYLYAGKYSLNIHTQDGYFLVELSIDT